VTPLGLPVEDILDSLKQQLSDRHEVVLEAPPGAGKTTLVPLVLMNEPWLKHRKILMLEPRRIATKTAAHRMASLLNESPGQTVGYRMRLDTKVTKHTKVEVITEGILTRMLQDDPSLDEVGLVIFDEFHERSLDSDLALSLCLKGRALFRDDDPLKILVMSATLDGDATSKLLGDAPVVKSEGRAYPVDIIYGQARQPKERVIDRMVATIKRAIDDNPTSSVLAFYPDREKFDALPMNFRTGFPIENYKVFTCVRSMAIYRLKSNSRQSRHSQVNKQTIRKLCWPPILLKPALPLMALMSWSIVAWCGKQNLTRRLA